MTTHLRQHLAAFLTSWAHTSLKLIAFLPLAFVICFSSQLLGEEIVRLPESLYIKGDQDGFGGGAIDSRQRPNGATLSMMDRMGIASYEGSSYYAVRDPSRGIRVTSTNGDPSSGSVQLAEPNRFNGAAGFFNPDPSRGAPFVAGLFPRGGVLYLIAFHEDTNNSEGAIVYVQGFIRKSSTDRTLETTDPNLNFRLPLSRGVINVNPVNSNGGILLHVLTRQANYGPAMLTLEVQGELLYNQTIKLIHAANITNEQMSDQRFASDGLATLESMGENPNDLDQIDYVVWLSKSGPLCIYRYSRQFNRHTATTTTTVLGKNNSIFHLVESGLEGDSVQKYPLTLINLYQSPEVKLVLKTIKLNVQDHGSGFAGGWSNIEFNHYHQASRDLKSTVIFGVNKADSVSDNQLDSAGFTKRFQQHIKLATLTFQGLGKNSYTLFDSFRVRGNIFGSDGTADSDSLKSLDTASPPNPGAWSVVGVIHGVPPYLPYSATNPYPSLELQYSAQQSQTVNVSLTTEDTKQVSEVLSVTKTGFIRPQAMLSVETSFSYGVKTSVSSSDSSSTSITTTESQTFEPASFAGRPNIQPGNVGMVIVSKPTYTTKTYRVKSWAGNDFVEAKRYLCLTQVSNRTLGQFYYLMDRPEAGPIDHPDYKMLTEGIPPIAAATSLSTWRNTPGITPADFEVFGVSGNVPNFFATYASTGKFSLSYLTSSGHAQGTSHSTTYKETVKTSIGVKDLINFSVAGEFTQSETLSTSQSTNFTFGQAITGTYPRLPNDSSFSEINVKAYLLTTKGVAGTRSAIWAPTRFQKSNNSFLLTWKVDTSPTSHGALGILSFNGGLQNEAGNELKAQLTGDAHYVSRGKPFGGKGIRLDGKGDSVVLSGETSPGPFTCSIWIKPEELGRPMTIVGQAGRFELSLIPATSGYIPRFQLGKTAIRGTAIPKDHWTYLTVTFEKNWGTISQNGVVIAKGMLVDAKSAGGNIVIGRGSEADFRGEVDHFGYWDRQLSRKEIREWIPKGTMSAPVPLPRGNSSKVAAPGDSVVLRGSSEGDGPFTYRWKAGPYFLSDGKGVTGTDTPHLHIANVRGAHAGTYRLLVSGPGGSTLSDKMELIVNRPPAETSEPQ